MAEAEVHAATELNGDGEEPKKRGRGRPPKKGGKVGNNSSGSKRGRGRPPKSGSPSKSAAPKVIMDEDASPDDVEDSEPVAKKARGRPAAKAASKKEEPPAKRGRGRPPANKNKPKSSATVKKASSGVKGRGRPKKNPEPESDSDGGIEPISGEEEDIENDED